MTEGLGVFQHIEGRTSARRQDAQQRSAAS